MNFRHRCHIRDNRLGEQVRYGLVGTGMMGVEHLHNLAITPGAVVTAIADPVATSLGWATDALGDRADGVTVSPMRRARDERAGRCGDRRQPQLHPPRRAGAAVRRRPHILCEKPLATTIEDARWIVEQADASDRRRSGPRWNTATCPRPPSSSREVHGGTIGTLRMLSIREHRFPFLPKVGDWNRFAATPAARWSRNAAISST